MQCGFHLRERLSEMLDLQADEAKVKICPSTAYTIAAPHSGRRAKWRKSLLPGACDLDEDALHASGDHFGEEFRLRALPKVGERGQTEAGAAVGRRFAGFSPVSPSCSKKRRLVQFWRDQARQRGRTDTCSTRTR